MPVKPREKTRDCNTHTHTHTHTHAHTHAHSSLTSGSKATHQEEIFILPYMLSTSTVDTPQQSQYRQKILNRLRADRGVVGSYGNLHIPRRP